IAPIRAGAIQENDAQFVLGNTKHAREIRAHAMRTLRSRPNSCAFGPEIGDSTRWTERRMTLEWPPVRCRHLLRGCRPCRSWIASVDDRFVAFDGGRAHGAFERVASR